MKELSCVIYVEPTPKGRPRSTIIAGHATHYTPKKTRTAEADIKAAIRREVMNAAGNIQFAPKVPLIMMATFYVVRPKHLPKRVEYPVNRPDLDNFAKTLNDALENYVYVDDSQIVDCILHKRYCLPGQVPRIELKIREEC